MGNADMLICHSRPTRGQDRQMFSKDQLLKVLSVWLLKSVICPFNTILYYTSEVNMACKSPAVQSRPQALTYVRQQ